MTVARTRPTMLLLAAFSLWGCGEKKPMLTFEALAAAAEKCGARELTFSRSGDASAAPSFSYLDPGPLMADKPTAVSACLAEALKDYRFEAMEIRFEPAVPVGRTSS